MGGNVVFRQMKYRGCIIPVRRTPCPSASSRSERKRRSGIVCRTTRRNPRPCHPRAGGDPEPRRLGTRRSASRMVLRRRRLWIPAFAGMTVLYSACDPGSAAPSGMTAPFWSCDPGSSLCFVRDDVSLAVIPILCPHPRPLAVMPVPSPSSPPPRRHARACPGHPRLKQRGGSSRRGWPHQVRP